MNMRQYRACSFLTSGKQEGSTCSPTKMSKREWITVWNLMASLITSGILHYMHSQTPIILFLFVLLHSVFLRF